MQFLEFGWQGEPEMNRKPKSIAAMALATFLAFGCASNEEAPKALSPLFEIDENRPGAPFGDQITLDIVNYSRVAPNVGLAGRLTEAGVREAKMHGFALIIDLRQPDEDGVELEQRIAGNIGLPYRNIPLSADETAWNEVDVIFELLRDNTHYPVLIHCGSANRAGAFWTLYRTRDGVDPIVAIEEGRAGGMRSREKQVRMLLGLPPRE